MYACKVGNNFKIDFFKRSLNFCYDKTQGIIYSSDLDVLQKLRIDSNLIENFSTEEKAELKIDQADLKIEPKTELIKYADELITIERVNLTAHKIVEEAIEKNNKDLRSELDNLKKKNFLVEQTIKELTSICQDLSECNDENQTKQESLNETVKNSIGILNKKIKDTNATIENSNTRVDVIIEMLTEQIESDKKIPNILKNGISIEKIWNSNLNKSTAAMLSIMVMIKKTLEEKGMKF